MLVPKEGLGGVDDSLVGLVIGISKEHLPV